MTYSNYATKLNNGSNLIEQILSNISEIDLFSSWEGNAAKKQIANLNNLLNNKSIQINNLEQLTSVLLLLDEYDNEKKLSNEYQTNINNLNTEDPNYQENKSRLISLKNQSINKYESLKQQIEDKLSNITTRYSEQYVDIPATTVENTVNLFLESKNKISTLDNHLTIKATPRNGDKISSDNAGTIQLDKQGTYYDKEPTPGKSAQKLHVYHNGQRLYDDACITIKKGETIRLTVNISDNAGNVKLLKRTSADGQEDWRKYLTGKSEPYVNRYDSSTFIATDNYDWVITGDKVTNGYITLSQTTFHSTDNAPEYKSMYRIKVKVVE
jgi:hypothetical protein